MCEELLESVHQINVNHRKVKKVFKLAQRIPNGKQYTKIYEQLASYSSLVNPLSDFGTKKFPKIYSNHKQLFKRLVTKLIRIKRKRKLILSLKKCGDCVLITAYTVLAIALFVLSCHGLVMNLGENSLELMKRKVTRKGFKRVGVQLDVAAKGIYTMIKDLDTMSWLVGRLYDEVEFGRSMARKCIENQNPDVLEEVVREFKVHERCFLEQLEELEDHIYLCLLNVNRSRKLLVEEINSPQD